MFLLFSYVCNFCCANHFLFPDIYVFGFKKTRHCSGKKLAAAKKGMEFWFVESLKQIKRKEITLKCQWWNINRKKRNYVKFWCCDINKKKLLKGFDVSGESEKVSFESHPLIWKFRLSLLLGRVFLFLLEMQMLEKLLNWSCYILISRILVGCISISCILTSRISSSFIKSIEHWFVNPFWFPPSKESCFFKPFSN